MKIWKKKVSRVKKNLLKENTMMNTMKRKEKLLLSLWIQLMKLMLKMISP